jgi:hypothetical protein
MATFVRVCDNPLPAHLLGLPSPPSCRIGPANQAASFPSSRIREYYPASLALVSGRASARNSVEHPVLFCIVWARVSVGSGGEYVSFLVRVQKRATSVLFPGSTRRQFWRRRCRRGGSLQARVWELGHGKQEIRPGLMLVLNPCAFLWHGVRS